ncbi:MAG: hypothetical protein K5864_07015 [Bacteroidales bacterium]|nr:hypothetical protein [Bacteroidales bacterium]
MGTRKKKKLVIVLIAVVLVAAIGTGLWFWLRPNKVSTEDYQPIEEFKEAYEALETKQKAPDYDLEKTIRVINSMEVAQSQSKDFDQFLEYLARQDYEGVAPEVLEAKKKMMPVLQEIYLLQKEHDELNFWTPLVQQLCTDPAASNMVRDAFTGQGIGAMLQFNVVANQIFEQYKKEQELKGELKRKIQEIRKDYLAYVEEFTPVYVKYMTEWDKLCIDKDKAYIDLYTNQPDAVVKDCEKILANYPTNREALLLRALGLILSSKQHDSQEMFNFAGISDTNILTQRDIMLTEAQQTLNYYMDLYPAQSAPALVVQGLLLDYQGDHQQAFSHYEQAAVEYPRQSEQLTDLLNCYRSRTYLNNSREGLYLLTLYKSTMEGFGFFSPNLIKAAYYDQVGDYDNCSKEIYNHFFRRSNQTSYDCLLADMRLCEETLPISFNRLLPERCYIDVTFGKQDKLLGLSSDDQQIKVTVENRSDHDLENLRVFLCIHFTDMYADDYHVVKLPTFNRITVRSKADVSNIDLNYMDKNFDHISSVRAIAMTDNSICWIDNVYNSTDNIDYNPAHQIDFAQLSKALDSNAMRSRDAYLSAIKKSDETFRQSILHNTRVTSSKDSGLLKKTRNYISIELPRELILLNPTFNWQQQLSPTENYLKGSYIHLSFDTEIPEGHRQKLYIATPYLNYAVTIQNAGGRLAVVEVKNMAAK